MNLNTKLRIARPTEDLERLVRFYVAGLGLRVVGSFHDHDGFDGVMVGFPGGPFHLEFTLNHGQADAARRPAGEHLLVFYLPDRREWQASVDRMREAGYRAVVPSNPYWDRDGATFEDPDGYRVVLENSAWPS